MRRFGSGEGLIALPTMRNSWRIATPDFGNRWIPCETGASWKRCGPPGRLHGKLGEQECSVFLSSLSTATILPVQLAYDLTVARCCKDLALYDHDDMPSVWIGN